MMTFKHTPIDDYPYIVYTNDPNGEVALITGVTISPLTASVAKGGNTTFAAKVVGNGDIDSTVAWSVDVESGGTLATGTAISSAGKLTVGANQATNKALYVTATTANGIESVPAVVTVTNS